MYGNFLRTLKNSKDKAVAGVVWKSHKSKKPISDKLCRIKERGLLIPNQNYKVPQREKQLNKHTSIEREARSLSQLEEKLHHDSPPGPHDF